MEEGEFTISLRMLSDWRIGTGTGAHGYADRLVQRDTEEAPRSPAAPIVPAKTLVGVWRDSCELAAYALDGGDTGGVWHAWLGFLFGGQYATATGVLRPAALVLDGPLRFPTRLAELLRVTPRVAWAATFRKPGVAIDGRTGTAKPGMLRFEEMARAGVTLEGRGRIDGFAELGHGGQEAALVLLGAGARLLEGIGGKRRRGAGRCEMTVTGPGFTPDWTDPSLKDVAPPPSASPYAVPERPARIPAAGRAGWERIELVITIEEPVLVAATVLGNLVEGESHIPGWCLMPEVARRLGGAAHALVRTGELLVTAATPESPGGSRTLPVPRVLGHEKGKPDVVSGNRMLDGSSPAKAYKSGYVMPDGEEAYAVITPPAMIRMHNTVSDDVQRPTRDVGGVYVYRALAAGIRLRAEVRVRTGRLAPGWETRLAGPWRVGRSSKDDYGKIRVKVRGVAEPRQDRAARDVLRVWLLSDLLVRDRRLRPSADLHDVARAMEQALARAGAPGVTLTPVTGTPGGGVGAALSTHRTESWHRGWQLPRATLYGLAAGSCLTFEVESGPVDAAILAEVRAAGVGERRAEGFGQVELDHTLLTQPVGRASARHSPEAVRPRPLAPGEEGHDTARVFERAAWRAEIHRACERICGDPAERAKVAPPDVPNSQLNALREITAESAVWRARADGPGTRGVRRHPEPDGAHPMGTEPDASVPENETRPTTPADIAGHRLAWLTRSRAGRDDWPKDAVEVVEQLVTGPDRVWELLGLPERELTLTADGPAVLRAELRHEAIRVLVNACLAAHARAEATPPANGRQAERRSR